MADSGSSAEGTPRREDEESARLEARLLRWDAAARRTEGKLERARAALARARAASERLKSAQAREDRRIEGQPGTDRAKTDEAEHATDRREARADEREARADEREARLDLRERRLRQEEAAFDERERLAEQAEVTREMKRSADTLRGSSGGDTEEGSSWASLAERASALRSRAAGLADRMADQAEQFAAHLQNATTPGDRERRLATAETELEIARIERRNAAKLRDQDHPFHLDEHLPKLPGTDPQPGGDTEGDAAGST